MRTGRPLFVRRQVHTESFEPALREQRFYEQLTDYLRTGYEAAGRLPIRPNNQRATSHRFCHDRVPKNDVVQPARHQTSAAPASAGAARARTN